MPPATNPPELTDLVIITHIIFAIIFIDIFLIDDLISAPLLNWRDLLIIALEKLIIFLELPLLQSKAGIPEIK